MWGDVCTVQFSVCLLGVCGQAASRMYISYHLLAGSQQEGGRAACLLVCAACVLSEPAKVPAG